MSDIQIHVQQHTGRIAFFGEQRAIAGADQGHAGQLDAGERQSTALLAEQRAGASWVEMLLASLALGALLLDWYFLRPKRVAANAAAKGAAS